MADPNRFAFGDTPEMADELLSLVIIGRKTGTCWAAANGDRSENGDYIYGRKKLREIDRRLGYLSKVMKEAKPVDPSGQSSRDQVRFGATVELADEDDERRILTIVGDDESDASSGLIGWSAPLARAIIGARVGDERVVRLPGGEKSYEVMVISYP